MAHAPPDTNPNPPEGSASPDRVLAGSVHGRCLQLWGEVPLFRWAAILFAAGLACGLLGRGGGDDAAPQPDTEAHLVAPAGAK